MNFYSKYKVYNQKVAISIIIHILSNLMSDPKELEEFVNEPLTKD
jgi:hypothetical protein